MTINEKVVANYNKLNNTDLHIWNYIDLNMENISDMTINDLAEKTNVSRTTISRFVNKIGYTGFSEFKYDLKNAQIAQLTNIEGQYKEICNIISQFVQQLSESSFEGACTLLYNSDRIFVYGSGDVQKNVGRELKRLLLSCQELVYDLENSILDPNILELLNDNDVIILISLSGNNESIVEMAQKFKLKGCKILSITNLQNNQLQNISDESLFILTPEMNYFYGQNNYKLTNLFYVLVELFIMQYGAYKDRRQSGEY